MYCSVPAHFLYRRHTRIIKIREDEQPSKKQQATAGGAHLLAYFQDTSVELATYDTQG